MASRPLNLRHIEAFRAVMLTGTMTEAARRMYTSQPQISRLVGQLESIVRFPLFDRGGGRLTPTTDGTRFYQEVEKAFSGLAGLEFAAASIRSFGAGRLAIASTARLAGGVLSRTVARFKRDNPAVMIGIHSGSASEAHNWVSSGLCDMGLTMLYEKATGVQIEPVFSTNCVVIVPSGHRLAARPRLRPADLADEPFVAMPIGSTLRDRTDRIFNAAGYHCRIVVEADLGASVCALVSAGLGISVINPLAALEEGRTLDIETRPFSPGLPVTIALLYPPYHPHSRLVDAFSACAREMINREFAILDHVGSNRLLEPRHR